MAPVRFIHTSDIHIGARYSTLPRGVADRRRNDLRETFAAIVDLATNGSPEVDLLLISGDLFETAFPASGDVFFVREKLQIAAKAGVRTFLIPGNHDEYRPGSFWDGVSLPVEHVFHDYTFEAHTVPELNLTVWGAAMNPVHTGERMLGAFPSEAVVGRSILLFHGNWLGYGPDDAPRYSPFEASDIKRLPVNYVALGHHHGFKQVVMESGRKALYPGSPEATTFGRAELGDRFVVRGEISEDGAVHVEKVKINKATHLAESIECTHETTESLRRRVGNSSGQENLLKLTLTGHASLELVAAAETLEEEMTCEFAHLEVRSEIADIDDEMDDNVYFRSFREDLLRRMRDAAPEEQPALRKALEIGTIAFVSGRQRGVSRG